MKFRIVLSVLALLCISITSALSVPELFNYSGRLTNPEGSAMASGVYKVSVRIWDAPVGGELLWGCAIDVMSKDGYFQMMLGSDSGTAVDGARFNRIGDAFSRPSAYLSLTILQLPDGNSPDPASAQFPRQQIASTAYAFQAERALHGVPVGTVVSFAGVSAPEGWLLCDGSTLDSTSQTALAPLFAVIGTKYGGSGPASFHLPDLQGRSVVGEGQGLTNEADQPGSVRELAETGGSETHKLTFAEQNFKQLFWDFRPEGLKKDGKWTDTAVPFDGSSTDWILTGLGGASTHVMHKLSYKNAQEADGHNNMSPYLVLNYIIKY